MCFFFLQFINSFWTSLKTRLYILRWIGRISSPFNHVETIVSSLLATAVAIKRCVTIDQQQSTPAHTAPLGESINIYGAVLGFISYYFSDFLGNWLTRQRTQHGHCRLKRRLCRASQRTRGDGVPHCWLLWSGGSGKLAVVLFFSAESSRRRRLLNASTPVEFLMAFFRKVPTTAPGSCRRKFVGFGSGESGKLPTKEETAWI